MRLARERSLWPALSFNRRRRQTCRNIRNIGGPPPVQERYVEQERYGYQQQPQAYYQPAPPPVVYQEYAPPALVPVPEPYYVPQRRVYVDPGYGYGPYAYAPRPYVARGYGYHRPHYHHHNHRHW